MLRLLDSLLTPLMYILAALVIGATAIGALTFGLNGYTYLSSSAFPIFRQSAGLYTTGLIVFALTPVFLALILLKSILFAPFLRLHDHLIDRLAKHA